MKHLMLYCLTLSVHRFINIKNISNEVNEAFTAGKEIEAMKCLMLHCIALLLHHFWCPAFTVNRTQCEQMSFFYLLVIGTILGFAISLIVPGEVKVAIADFDIKLQENF
jgi:hypothetical protein